MDALSVVFGIHTLEMTHVISNAEAVYIKSEFGLKMNEELLSTNYFQYGINELEIVESLCKYNGKCTTKYQLRFVVNASRALSNSNYLVMTLTVANIKRLLKQLNQILQKMLRLSMNNGNADKWKVKRLDIAYDIKFPNPDLLIRLMNFSFDVNHKNCNHKYIPNANKEQVLSESLRFGNNSYTYNIYAKLKQLQNERKQLTVDELNEVKDIVRCEKQHNTDSIKKILGVSRELGALMNPKTIENIQRTMQKDILVFFGKGSFYSCDKSKQIITSSSYSVDKQKAMVECLVKISKNGLFKEPQYANGKEIKMLENIGITRAGIKKEEIIRFGVDEIQGLYDMITSFYPLAPSKRKKNEFPKPRKDSYGRWKSNISLHYVYSTKTKMYSVADKDKETYERKVLDKLTTVYTVNLANVKYDSKLAGSKMFLKSKDDILRFRRSIESKKVKKETDLIIKKYNL